LKVQGPNNYVNLVSDSQKLSESDSKKVNAKLTASKPVDKLEISEKGKLLNEGKVSVKDLDSIKAKIESGFYNSDEILGKVADAILKEIKGS
jgi:anti-sigma28 factor (negative regulator of flagellin synthesis)